MSIRAGIFAAAHLPSWLFNSANSTNRWLHLVATTSLVGGVLFFMFVVPIATSDLKVEHQLAVFGKARWIFRKIVVWSVLALVVTGGFSIWRMWPIYSFDESDVHSAWASPNHWAIAHVIFAILGAAILIRVTATRRILGHPVGWLRVVLGLLLVAMLVASIARQLSLNVDDERIAEIQAVSAR
jgi:hypothetical protein